MNKKFIITEEDRGKILSMHKKNGYKSINIFNLLNEAPATKQKSKWRYCNTFPISKGCTGALTQKIQGCIGVYADGKFGNITEKKLMSLGFGQEVTLQTYNEILKNCGKLKKTDTKIVKDKIKTDTTKTDTTKTDTTKKVINTSDLNDVNCISVSSDTCKSITANKETLIGSGSEKEGCSAWAVKCLSQYDSTFKSADAWTMLPTMKQNGGTEKYNMFTDGSINWTNLQNDIIKNKINLDSCNFHASEGLHKDHQKPLISKIISNNYPSSSSVNLSDLKLGDVVGMYWSGSSNKGKAFCQRAIKRGLDSNGKFKDNTPFTFNTHVGFVGAIKDGEPIIFHNVEGKWLATPAKNYQSKSGKAMITWVASDPDISQEKVKVVKKQEKTWLEKNLIDPAKKYFSWDNFQTESDLRKTIKRVLREQNLNKIVPGATHYFVPFSDSDYSMQLVRSNNTFQAWDNINPKERESYSGVALLPMRNALGYFYKDGKFVPNDAAKLAHGLAMRIKSDSMPSPGSYYVMYTDDNDGKPYISLLVPDSSVKAEVVKDMIKTNPSRYTLISTKTPNPEIRMNRFIFLGKKNIFGKIKNPIAYTVGFREKEVGKSIVI